jgi:ribosomal protein L37AE/L43A
MPASTSTTATCPYCRTSEHIRQTTDTGRIQAWACDRCDTIWAFTVPDSRTAALLGDLGAVAREIRRLRWTLAQVITLADQASWLTDRELRTRLLALVLRMPDEPLLGCLAAGGAPPGACSRHAPGVRPHVPDVHED